MHWTPEYVMHGISYAALMIIIDALPTHEKKERQPDGIEELKRRGFIPKDD